jgi:hypothetical protein
VRIIAAFALALLASSAKAADVDWKMYGGASLSGTSFCFYDTNSVAHQLAHAAIHTLQPI